MPSPVRPNVLRMHPYSPGKPIDELRRELGLDRIIKLASNENAWGPSPLAMKAVREGCEAMNLYPDGAAFDLKSALSLHYGVPSSQIAIGNGSDELIHLLGLILLESEDDEVVVGDPSFVRYDAAAHLAPCKLVKVPLDSEGRFDLQAMARALTSRTRLVFIANPNNPTGTIVERDELRQFIDVLPEQTTLVLDEAYYEFAVEFADRYSSSLEFLSRGNVVGLRTFSKAYGLAGIRLGFGFFPEWLEDAIERARAPFNVSTLALAAGVAALRDTGHLRKTLDGTAAGLRKLDEVFTEVGAKPIRSYANFAFARFGRPTRPLFQALLEQGVIVRPGDVLGDPNALRVTVGTSEEMEVFADCLRCLMKEVALR